MDATLVEHDVTLMSHVIRNISTWMQMRMSEKAKTDEMSIIIQLSVVLRQNKKQQFDDVTRPYGLVGFCIATPLLLPLLEQLPWMFLALLSAPFVACHSSIHQFLFERFVETKRQGRARATY